MWGHVRVELYGACKGIVLLLLAPNPTAHTETPTQHGALQSHPKQPAFRTYAHDDDDGDEDKDEEES